ncbi:discoidin domain-containing protein, partial [Kitasatospora sp. NPDC057015]|uniref:discoidin domain-containing protein n=1 Tax=Kitasatospora sp. NPDC057015 TaxID=3346001 RepID=UPI0036251175
MLAPPARSAVGAERSSPGWRAVAATLAAALVAALMLFVPTSSAQAAPVLLSQGKPVTASSEENYGTPATNAVDGNTGTRWSSANTDPQWIQVDLGAPSAIGQVVLNWES